MKPVSVEQITGIECIYSNDDYVVLTGKELAIVRHDGTLIARRKDIRNAGKVAFLPHNQLLVGGGIKTSYQLLSLHTGESIWQVPRIKKIELPSNRFALSSDHNVAYDYFSWKDYRFLSRIDLTSGSVETFPIRQHLRATRDLLCDENDVPCVLQTHYDELPGGRVGLNGVFCQTMDQDNTATAKYEWQHEGITLAKRFLNSTKCILTNDLHVYMPENKKMFYLLENDTQWSAPDRYPCDAWLERSGKYITLMYSTGNVVIDMEERRVIARYRGGYGRGCLIDDEYWIPSDTGIRRVPFPVMEEVPPPRPIFWKPGI